MAAALVLEQCAAFVESLPDTVFTAEALTVRGGTIGKHVRHLIDHYRAAIDAAMPDAAPIDYDHRERDVPMETDRSAALGAIRAEQARARGLTPAALARPVRVRVMLSAAGEEAVLDSTVGREVAFATHHAVHHQAMMRTIAAEFGIQASVEFGKAPSTLNHERTRPGGPRGRGVEPAAPARGVPGTR